MRPFMPICTPSTHRALQCVGFVSEHERACYDADYVEEVDPVADCGDFGRLREVGCANEEERWRRETGPE